MDVLEAIRSRRSVRRYTGEKVRNDVVVQLMEAAHWAPSASNKQPWEFIVCTDPAMLQHIADNSRYAKFLPEAANAIIVVGNFERKRTQAPYPEAIQYFCIQDTAAAIQNILLAAHALGLGTCWIGDIQEEMLREMFHIPAGYTALGIIAMGVPTESPDPRARRPVEEILHWEAF